jgi:hypothetical protein
VKFQEVTLPKMPSRYAVEVVSPQGWTVRLQNSSEIEALPQLLQALYRSIREDLLAGD